MPNAGVKRWSAQEPASVKDLRALNEAVNIPRTGRIMGKKNSARPSADIAYRIPLIRGHRIMLDSDLAELYGVATKRLNEQVRRNADRFPGDFMFQLTRQEATNLRSQSATLRRPDLFHFVRLIQTTPPIGPAATKS